MTGICNKVTISYFLFNDWTQFSKTYWNGSLVSSLDISLKPLAIREKTLYETSFNHNEDRTEKCYYLILC